MKFQGKNNSWGSLKKTMFCLRFCRRKTEQKSLESGLRSWKALEKNPSKIKPIIFYEKTFFRCWKRNWVILFRQTSYGFKSLDRKPLLEILEGRAQKPHLSMNPHFRWNPRVVNVYIEFELSMYFFSGSNEKKTEKI